MDSTNDDDATRVPHSLPTEIIHRIIQLSLPRLSFKTFRERYDTLLGFMGVDKRWTELAQRELVRHVLLRKEEEASAFVRVRRLEEWQDKSTRSLWLGEKHVSGEGLRSVPSEQVNQAVQSCPRLQLFCTLSVNGAAQLDLYPLAEDVEELRLDGCSFTPALELPLQFKQLRRLTLSYLHPVKLFGDILLKAELPSLDALAVIFGGALLPGNGQDPLLNGIRRVAPRLLSFPCSMVGWKPFELPDDLWQHFGKLEALALDHDHPISDAIMQLPSLRTFQLRPHLMTEDGCRPVSLTHVHKSMSARDWAWEGLRTLLLPRYNVDDLDVDEEEDEEEEEKRREQVAAAEIQTMSEIVDQCQAQGVEVIDRSPYELSDYSGYMEDALDFW